MKLTTALALLLIANWLSAGISMTQDGLNIDVHIDGELFTEFRTDRHIPCLYPLMSPDGTHMTRQYPFEKDIAGESSDHPHHIGFWFTHGDVNGHDFWHGRRGEQIVTREIQLLPARKIRIGHEIRFMAELDWLAKQKKVLSETRTYTITQRGKNRIIDVTCRLKATEGELVFGDTKEAGLGLRVAPTMRLRGDVAKGGILNSEGIAGRDAWGKRAKWVAYHGPDSAGTPTVAAIMDHPENLRHPTWWHARDYGLLAANPFGAQTYGRKALRHVEPHKLAKGETLTLKYRLILYQGEADSSRLEAEWRTFAEHATTALPQEKTILALGDSITAGGKGYPTYRQFLAPELRKQGYRFIGPMKDAYSAHAGFGGKNSGFILEKIGEIYGNYPADIVLLHAGHNHFAKDDPVPQIVKDTEAIIESIHQANPSAIILVAQVIPAGKLPKYSYIPELNRKLAKMVERLSKNKLPVFLVDQASGFDWHTDTLKDKVHPNESGAIKMAESWLEAIQELIYIHITRHA